MDGILTARLPASLLRRLRDRARSKRTTVSELVRAVLGKELGPTHDDASALERTRRWVGAVDSSLVPAGRDARSALAAWSADRRGR